VIARGPENSAALLEAAQSDLARKRLQTLLDERFHLALNRNQDARTLPKERAWCAIAGGIAVTGLDSRETADRAALKYDSTSLRNAGEKRDADQKTKVAELRKRFVDRPVLVLPNAGGSFSSSGITPIPAVGTVLPEVHVTAARLRPVRRGWTLEGEGWTLKLALGWVVRAGNRPGDFQLVRDAPRQ
jgi:acetyl-CoA carboxylase carboxyltransferase component